MAVLRPVTRYRKEIRGPSGLALGSVERERSGSGDSGQYRKEWPPKPEGPQEQVEFESYLEPAVLVTKTERKFQGEKNEELAKEGGGAVPAVDPAEN